MEEPYRHIHTLTFQNHKIRTVQRDGFTWFVNSDICQALGIADSTEVLDYLTPVEKNVIEGQKINDPRESLLTNNSEGKDFILSRILLSDIHTEHLCVTGDILSKVQSLHLKALGTSNLQAIHDTMQELRAYPKEYAKTIQHIDRPPKFYFDYPAKTTIGGL